MKLKTTTISFALASILTVVGCGGGNSSKSTNINENITADLVISTMIDMKTGFISAVDGSKTNMTSENGVDTYPFRGLSVHNGLVYTTGTGEDDKIAKYSITSGNTLKLVKEFEVKDGTGGPTTFIFVDDKKAYLLLSESGEVLDINLEDFSIRQRIDLSEYAMDENAQLGGSDKNPEPSAGVIRDGKLYLALGQRVGGPPSEGGWSCRGKASVVIIDIATNKIQKHISDDRTCSSGAGDPGSELTLTENGDIYVNNTASFGFDMNGNQPGYLRIKADEEIFDPNYFFNIGELDLSADFPDMNASLAKTPYIFKEKYHNGKLYVTTLVSGLTTGNPNDFIGNKNYQPYTLDLENKTATKLDMLPSSGVSTSITKYKGDIIFASSTVDANGLYRAGEKTPFLTTDGFPVYVNEF